VPVICQPRRLNKEAVWRPFACRSLELWEELEYRPGARVVLHGLKSAGGAKYNGALGTVLGLQRGKGRYVAQLDPEGEVRAWRGVSRSPMWRHAGDPLVTGNLRVSRLVLQRN
jgi:hypothetical protein